MHLSVSNNNAHNDFHCSRYVFIFAAANRAAPIILAEEYEVKVGQN